MKSGVIFVFLEYFIGFIFAVAGMFIFPLNDYHSLFSSIFYGFLAGFICMFVGIGLVGYFHLRMMRVLNKFVPAMMLTLLGLVLFSFLYLFIQQLLPGYLGILVIIIPLTGGVMGFNLALPKNKEVA